MIWVVVGRVASGSAVEESRDWSKQEVQGITPRAGATMVALVT